MSIQTVNLAVRGMTCGNCARTIEHQLSGTPGVTKASVDLASSVAIVEYDPDLVKPEVLANEVRKLGYEIAT